MTTNASFIFYRDESYGKKLNKNNVGEILGASNNLNNILIQNIPYWDYFTIPDARTFQLKTTYPGLIIGAGYNHPAGELEEDKSSDFQLGFYFDHTTGMPVIPGSTVKGIIKSIFPKESNDKNKGDNEEVQKGKLDYINDILKDKNVALDINNWEKLFEKGNIFYDAYISKASPDEKIFADDYITPHKYIFKNPIPIRFLKIAPDVTFTFQFKLIDTCFGECKKISINDKLKLFKKIILDFGIGAKRNVGYGNFVE